MKYEQVAAVARLVGATPKRSEKVTLIAGLLAATPPPLVPVVVGLVVGEPRQGRMGVGWSTRSKAQVAPAEVPTVEVAEVDRVLGELAITNGEGSQARRHQLLTGLLAAMTPIEQQHLLRVLGGEMRQGANDGVVAEAAAKAAGVVPADLRRAAMLLGDLGEAARRAMIGESLDVGLEPLIGVQPMLAATSTSVAEALADVGEASVEWKLDGARIQVHRRGRVVRVFTRSLHEISGRLPEVVDLIRRLPGGDIVLDGESLGLDADGGPLAFQDTMQAATELQPFFFDVLHLDGQSLIDEPLSTRKQLLTSVVPIELIVPSIITSDAATAQRFADEGIAAGHEGVMVKAIGGAYEAGRRGNAWRKVKPVHTLDLVVIAAEWGHGRRVGWLSNLHLAARGDDGWVMVGKTFKGMTDELLIWQTQALLDRQLATDGHVVHVRPELVVEIAVDGVQRSTRYPGGVALRFARVRSYRLDKTPSEADTIATVRGIRNPL